MLRRLVVTAAASLASVAALGAGLPATAHAEAGPLPLPALFAAPDHLTVKVSGSERRIDGTYRLDCSPAGGTHPDPEAACRRLDQLGADGRDPFAPVPAGAMCTLQYGGSTTAHVTGRWHGRAVDTTYERTNGCEISRWNTMVPVLPAASRAR
ncbi:SSI family serine proteinase inhibitor [Streptomyces sp. NPDC058001]|uniref:SSI family serine proteinase inhibitor n=1 Tax=Streptomyces sp. NPDC058001 TaxID=3346300 RepID=UPI0036E69F4C